MTLAKTPSTKTPLSPTDNEGRSPSVTGGHNANNKSVESGQAGFRYGWVVWLVLFAVGGAAWYYHERWWPQVSQTLGLAPKPIAKPPQRVIPVVTATVQKKDMEVFINGLGTVTAFKTVTVRSRVEGELVKVLFTEGQLVKEGDQIAEIDRRPFDVQRQQAEGQLARDEATLKSAELTLMRYQELLNSKSITAQQVDEQRSLVKQTAGAIQSDLATVANAKLQLEYCHIIAPIGGRIGLRLVDQGNIVRANDPTGLAVITQLQPISLVFTIPQDDIARVQLASTAGRELVVTAFDRGFKTRLATGKLLAIDNQVDSTTGTVRLKAVFDNEDNLLFPNQFVNARLLVDTKKDAIVVPTAAVQRGPNSMFVYVVQQDGEDEKVDLRNVTTGLIEGSETAIESGLEPGEIVVTEGLDKLQKDVKVTTKEKEGKVTTKEKEGKEKGGSEKGSKSSEKTGAAPVHGGHGKAESTTKPESPNDGDKKSPSGGEKSVSQSAEASGPSTKKASP